MSINERRVIDGIPMWVHKVEYCSGMCPIHNPSSHPLSDAPLYWRGDRGFFERICRHGVGHPDPDSMAYLRSLNPRADDTHGCDGCCSGEVIEQLKRREEDDAA